MTILAPIHHENLTKQVGWRYCEKTDRYYMQSTPTWEIEKNLAKAEKQGALPSSSVEEFKKKNQK